MDNKILNKMKYKYNEKIKKLKNERLRDKKPEILSITTNFNLLLDHLKKPIPYKVKMTSLYEKYQISFEKLIHFLIEPIHIKKSNNNIIDIKIRSKKYNNQIVMFLKFKSKNNNVYETILLRNFFENQRFFIIFDEEFNEKDPIFSRITIIKETKEIFIDLKCSNYFKKQDYFDLFSEFLLFKKQKCVFFDQEQIRTKEISDLIFLNKKKFIGYKNRALSTFISKNIEESFLKNLKKKKRGDSENIKKFEDCENCENFEKLKNLKKLLIFQQNKILSNIINIIPIHLNRGIDIYKLNLPNIFFSKKSVLEILSSFFFSCEKILKKTDDFLEISKFYLCFLFDFAQNSCKIKFPKKGNKGETIQIQYQNLIIYLETIISDQNSQIYYLNLIKNNEWKITGSISLNFICQGLKFIQKIKPKLKLTVNKIEIFCEKFPKIEVWIENNEKNYIFLGKLKLTDSINKIYSEISFGNSFSFGEINQNNKCFRGELYSLKNNEKARKSKIFGKIDEYIEFDGNLYWQKEIKAEKYIFKPIENEFILPSDCLNRKIIKKAKK